MRRFAETLQWADDRGFAIDAAVDERVGFIRKTYLHLTAELGAVGLLAWMGTQVPLLQSLALALWSNFIIYFACFLGASFITRKLLAGHKPMSAQYLGAGIWVFLLGLLVTPLVMIAPGAILAQGFVLTLCAFVGITAYVFTTKKDFSYIGGALSMATMILIGIAFLSFFMGGMGSGFPWFSVLAALLMCGWILYDTSRMLHHRRVGEHVAASVDLLVDFVYLFIHIVILLLGSRD